MRAFFVAAVAVAAFVIFPGCTNRPGQTASSYHTVAKEPTRDTETAKKLSEQGLAQIKKDKLADAEITLKKALEADVDFAPAHNNLGWVYYQQEKFYLAAWEFQYAAKLMPNAPRPLNNVGLVYEAAGNLDEAIQWFDKALKLQPDDPEILANAASARYRRGDRDDALREMLKKVSLRDERPPWRDWARHILEVDWHLAASPHPATSPSSKDN